MNSLKRESRACKCCAAIPNAREVAAKVVECQGFDYFLDYVGTFARYFRFDVHNGTIVFGAYLDIINQKIYTTNETFHS